MLPIFLCLWPDVIREGHASFQVGLGGNQDVIFSP